jgi:hypothetical protein
MYFLWKNRTTITKLYFTKKIKLNFQTKIESEICFYLPNAFWKKEQYVVDLSYDDIFNKKQILTKARPI